MTDHVQDEITKTYREATGRGGQLESAEIGFLIVISKCFGLLDKEIAVLKKEVAILKQQLSGQ